MNNYKKVSKKSLDKHSKVVNGVRYVDEGIHLLDHFMDSEYIPGIGFIQSSENEISEYDEFELPLRFHNSNYYFQNIYK